MTFTHGLAHPVSKYTHRDAAEEESSRLRGMITMIRQVFDGSDISRNLTRKQRQSGFLHGYAIVFYGLSESIDHQ